tara:strand:- start:7169 stop:8209 length:1041 start_codon:yes stop_codon:yes gene_type:complete
MVSVAEVVGQWIPTRARTTSKGWRGANAVCCHHRGHKPDSRGRGNWLVDSQSHVSYSCYNCGFRCRYTGDGLTDSFRMLLSWMSVPQDIIDGLKMHELQKSFEGSSNVEINNSVISPEPLWEPDPWPQNSQLISQLLEQNNQDLDFLQAWHYINQRGPSVMRNSKYFWSPYLGRWKMRHRVLIPLRDQKTHIVGYSARWAGTPSGGQPRYVNSKLPTDYLFNSHMLYNNRHFVVVVEGLLTAISIDCVAVMSHVLSQGQISQLQHSGKEIIIMPDQEQQNQDLIDQALQLNWAVSFPQWEESCKDAADAALRYGELFTVRSIIDARTTSDLKIGVLRQTIGKNNGV